MHSETESGQNEVARGAVEVLCALSGEIPGDVYYEADLASLGTRLRQQSKESILNLGKPERRASSASTFLGSEQDTGCGTESISTTQRQPPPRLSALVGPLADPPSLHGIKSLLGSVLKCSRIGAILSELLLSPENEHALRPFLHELAKRAEPAKQSFMDGVLRYFDGSDADRTMIAHLAEQLRLIYGSTHRFFFQLGYEVRRGRTALTAANYGEDDDDDNDDDGAKQGVSLTNMDLDEFIKKHLVVMMDAAKEAEALRVAKKEVFAASQALTLAQEQKTGDLVALDRAQSEADANMEKALDAVKKGGKRVCVYLPPQFALQITLNDKEMAQVLLAALKMRKAAGCPSQNGMQENEFCALVVLNYDNAVVTKGSYAKEGKHNETALQISFVHLGAMNHGYHSWTPLGLVNAKDSNKVWMDFFERFFKDLEEMPPFRTMDPITKNDVLIHLKFFKPGNDMMAVYSLEGHSTFMNGDQDAPGSTSNRRFHNGVIGEDGQVCLKPTRNLTRKISHSLNYDGKKVAVDPLTGAKTGLLARCAGSGFGAQQDALHAGGRGADTLLSKWIDIAKALAKKNGLRRNPKETIVAQFRELSKPTIHLELVARKSTKELTLTTQLGFTFFRVMGTENWDKLVSTMEKEIRACCGAAQNQAHVRLFQTYARYFRMAFLPFLLEDPEKFKKAAFYSPLYSHLLLSLTASAAFGAATPTFRNLASQMHLHLSDCAKIGVTARGSGGEGAESGVGLRQRLQPHFNGALGGNRGSEMDRTATMLTRKFTSVVWHHLVAPTVAPGLLGAAARHRRATKRVQKQQGEVQPRDLPTVGFQLPLKANCPLGEKPGECLEMMGDAAGTVNGKVVLLASKLDHVIEGLANIKLKNLELTVGPDKCDSISLELTLYTNQSGGWDKLILKDTATKACICVRAYEINNHAVFGEESGRFSLLLQLKRAPKNQTATQFTGVSLGQLMRTEKYRNIKITGGTELQQGWESWCGIWSLKPPVSEPNRRSTFRADNLFDSQDGSEALRSLLEFEESKGEGKHLNSPALTKTPAAINSILDSLEGVENKWLQGIGSPQIFCESCKGALFLRELWPVPRWCFVSNGEPHDDCAELRLWGGTVGVTTEADATADNEGDEDEDENGGCREEGEAR